MILTTTCKYAIMKMSKGSSSLPRNAYDSPTQQLQMLDRT